MYVDPASAELTLVRGNRTYYFCARACLEEFADPARELARLRRALLVAWPLSLGVLVLVYGVPQPWAVAAAATLATVVVAYPGARFFRGTLDAYRSRTWNMDVLVAVSSSVAYGYSLADWLAPGRLPPGDFFDAASLIVTLILTGTYLELRTRERARGALRGLSELVPAVAEVRSSGGTRTVPIGSVRPGDEVRVAPGARFPSDGVVVAGRSDASEALVSGESLPVPKVPGEAVLAGSVNGEGELWVRATAVGQDTRVAEIARLAAEAETSRIPLQRRADHIAAVFVPAVLALALATGFGWYLAGAGLAIALLAFVAVSITACPCAFGLATPAAIVVGVGRAAEAGILFRGSDSLEQASRVDLVLLDKTGTLTGGRPEAVAVAAADGRAEAEVLATAAGLERGSSHPLGRAVVELARARAVAPRSVTDLRIEPGVGVAGRFGGHEVAVRRPAATPAGRAALGALGSTAAEWSAAGRSWSVVEEAGEVLGLVAFADPASERASEAIAMLRADGVEVEIVSGDRSEAVRNVAEVLGITRWAAAQMPADKIARVRARQAEGRRVAFVGDGINDAPALAAADVGLAIGAGPELAQAAAGIVLLGTDLRGVARALRLARRTVGRVRANFTWAIGYNAVLIPVAMGVLVPWFGLGLFAVLPIAGALAMGLSSTSVLLNSLTLRWVPLD